MPQEDYEDDVESGPISLLDLAEMESKINGSIECEYCGAKAYPTRIESMRGCCLCLPERIAEKAMERFIAGAA